MGRCSVLLTSLAVIAASGAVQARTWTDATGKFTVDAEFVDLVDGQVRLRKPDGKVIAVPLAKLSTGDQLQARQQARRAPAAKPVPTSDPAAPQIAPARGGKTELQIPATHGGFFSFAFSPDGKTVAGGTGIISDGDSGKLIGGGEVVLWDAASGQLVRTLGSHSEGVTWVAFSRDGAILASFSEKNHTLKIWSAKDGRLQQSQNLPIKAGEVKRMLLAPDASEIVVVVQRPIENGVPVEYDAFVWDVPTGKEKWKLPHSSSTAVAISPDGSTVAAHVVTVADRQVVSEVIQICNARTGEVQGKIEAVRNTPGHSPRVDLVFLPDGKTLAGLTQQNVLFWDVATGALKGTLRLASDSPYREMAFSPDGAKMVLARFQGEAIEVWDLAMGRPQGMLSFRFPNTIWYPAFSADLLRVACHQQGPVILDLTALEPLNAPPSSPSSTQNPPSVDATSSKNLARTAKASASSTWPGFAAANAVDGAVSTRWNSQDGDAVGAWIAVEWDQPQTIQSVVFHQAYDRIIDFTLQRFDAGKNEWTDLLQVFANRHESSYSRNGGQSSWAIRPGVVEVDGKPLESQKDRLFGSDPDASAHLVFTIDLPDPLTTTAVRIHIRETKARTVSISELEAYGP